jgi:hypothetical protein
MWTCPLAFVCGGSQHLIGQSFLDGGILCANLGNSHHFLDTYIPVPLPCPSRGMLTGGARLSVGFEVPLRLGTATGCLSSQGTVFSVSQT